MRIRCMPVYCYPSRDGYDRIKIFIRHRISEPINRVDEDGRPPVVLILSDGATEKSHRVMHGCRDRRDGSDCASWVRRPDLAERQIDYSIPQSLNSVYVDGVWLEQYLEAVRRMIGPFGCKKSLKNVEGRV